MRVLFRRGSSVVVALTFLSLVTGCIAVSREVERGPSSGSVIQGGQWEVDQEWRCRNSEVFDLEAERQFFRTSMRRWTEDGWELADFDVASFPATSVMASQTCLVATFRRWKPADS